jgi:cytochrome c
MAKLMMKNIVFIGMLCVTASSHAAVDAAMAKDIAGKNACMGCHGVNHKIVGPSFKDISKKYNGDKEAVGKLVKKIKAGGSGVWGPVSMPANTNLSDADARLLVQWVLEGAK